MIRVSTMDPGKGREPRQHPRRLEMHLRLELVKRWISRGMSPVLIHKYAQEEWGVSKITVRNYVRRARAAMLGPFKGPLEGARSEAVCFYNQVLSDPDASYRDKLHAMREKLAVLGALERKLVVEHQGGLGIEVNGTVSLEAARELITTMREDRRLRDEIYTIHGLEKTIAGGAPTNGSGSALHVPGTNGTNGHNGKVPGP
jgi:uncharacterized protein (DUF2164 family)